MLQSALDYAAHGWRVLPVHGIIDGVCTCRAGANCTSPGKHPAVRDWVNRATVEPDRIAAAWGNQPQLNIGIATGSGSGILVLDIDPAHGGDASLAALEEQHGRLPATLTAITGSGGRHIVFSHVPGVGNKGGFAPGLDIRGDGGQIVAAPSRHWSGGVYSWSGTTPWYDQGVVPPPPWLLALICEQPSHRRPEGSPLARWRDLFATGAATGGRNNAVAAMAGYFLKLRIDPLLTLDMVQLWNDQRVVPPLTRAEVEQTVNSVAAKELQRIKRRRE